MKIVIPGGSGQVGTLLSRTFHREGHEVVVLSRHAMPRPWRVISWDGVSFDRAWGAEIDGCDVVINLAGRSVNCRYTPANKRDILDSRVRSTRVVGEAIARASHPPRVWLQASTATIYAHRFDAANDDITGAIGRARGGVEPDDVPKSWAFSIDVARAWEDACVQAVTPGTRKVLLRSAMTMSPDPGGIFDTLLALVRRGLGGQAGDGRQFVSWIHEADFVRAVRWLIEHDRIDGPVNLASPHPLPNAAFMRALREAWGTPIGLPATRWMLELGALFMRTDTELILKSRRVVPRRLLDDGFVFTHAHWADAARDLCGRWMREPSRQMASAAQSGLEIQ
jgi:uncharacterized protein (TIGR01777 family)